MAGVLRAPFYRSSSGATQPAKVPLLPRRQVVILATTSWDPSKAPEQIQALAASLGDGTKGKVLIDVINGLSGWPALSLG